MTLIRFACPILLCLLLTSCGGSAPVIEIGGDIPAFKVKTLDGQSFSNAQLDDRPTIINFWATWCQPCRKEIPALKEISNEGSARVIGIALDQGGAPPVKNFIKKQKMDYEIVLGDEKVFRDFNGYGIPHTLVLDRSQKIVAIHRGIATKEQLMDELAGL